MAGRYNAGSVDVKITLDSKEFEETIKKLKGQTKEIQEQMRTSSEASSSYINNLKKSVDNLKKGQQELYGSTSQTNKGLKEEAESIKNLAKVSEANVKTLDNTIKKNNELVKSNNKVKQEVDKLTASEKQLEKQTEKSTSRLQQFFTQTLHDKIWQYGAKGSKGVFADGIRNQMKYIFGDMAPSEFDKYFAQALKDMGVKSRGTGSNQILDFGGYFKPNIEGVKELKRGLDEVASSAEKTTQSMKTLEKQTNFGMTNLEKAFTKSLFTEIGKYTPHSSGQNDLVIPLKPIFDVLEKEYMQYAKNMANFKKLWKVGLTATGTYLTKGTDRYGMGIVRFNEAEKGFSQINVTALKTKEEVKRAMMGIKTSVDEVTSSTEKAATATKELETAMLDLSGKTKYTYQQLWENFDKLPLKIQTALEGMNRAMYRSVTRLNYSPFSDEFANGLKAWGELIPMLKSLPLKDITLPDNIDAHLEKYVYQVELLQKLFASRKSALEFNGGSASFDKIYIADLKKLKKELIETEIVSRKTGEAVKQLGASEEQTTTKTKKLTNETKQLVQSLKPITTETSLTDLKAASIDTLTQMIGKANAQAKQLSDNIKQLPVANDNTTQSAVRTLDIFKQINLTKEQQLALEKEIMRTMGAETYNYISNLKRGRTSTGVLGTDSALWKRYNGMTGRVKTFDYDKFVTHMQRIFKGILPEELYNEMWSKFSRRFKIGQVPPFQGQGGIKENYWEQLGYYEGVSSINELRESVQGLIGTTEELNAVEEQAAAQTNKWAEGTEAYKAQLIGLSSLIKGYNGLGKRYKQTNEEIINSLTRMAEANEKVSGSAQKAYNNLDKLREIRYNFGFKGLDAEDIRFITSTLRAVKEMQIVPKNPLIRLFSGEDIKFAEHLFTLAQIYAREGIIPADKIFSTGMYWGEEGNWARRLGESSNTDTKEGKQIAKKTAQVAMNKIFDYLGVELIETAEKGGKRFYDSHTGKTKSIIGIDISKVPKDWNEIEKAMNGAVDTAKLLELEEEAISREAQKISIMANLIISRIHNAKHELIDVALMVSDIEHSLSQINKARKSIRSGNYQVGFKGVTQDANKFSESIEQIGTVTVTTTSSVDDLGLGLETVAQEEKKVVQSTDKVTNSLQKAITQANNLKGAINKSLRGYATDFEDMYFEQGSVALRKLYEANVLKYYGKLDPSQWLKEVYEWGAKVEGLDISKFIGAYSDLTNFRFLGTWKDVNSILEAFNEVDEAINKVAVDLEVINRVRIGDNWTVTLKSTGQAVKETVATLDNFTNNAQKTKDVEKQLETGTKEVGESAKKAAAEITQLVSAIQPITANVSLSGLKDLTNKNLSENIRKAVTQANQLESAIKQINASANQTGNTLERVSRIRIGDNWKVKLIPTSFKEESSKATESIHKIEDEFKNFRNESSKTARSVKKDWKNIFQQLNEMDEALWGKGSNMSSRDLRLYSFDKEGFETGFKVIANTTQALKTFDSTVITVAEHTREMMESLRFKDEDGNIFGVDPAILKEYDLFIKRYETLQQRMYALSRGLGANRNAGKKNTGYGALLESMGMTIGAGDNVINMADALSSEGSLGRLNVEGYSDYVARITEIKQALIQASEATNSSSISAQQYKEQLIQLAEAIKLNANSLTGYVGKSEQAIKAMTQMAEANERFKQATDPTKINQLIQRLEHFSSISEKNKRSLQNLSEQATILKDRFNVINNEFRSGMLSEEAYDKETKKLIADLEKLGATATTEIRKLNTAKPTELEKVNNTINKSRQSLNEFGKTMNNQEQYVNNLYRGLQKARSVIISMKTILRMMGGMAVWNFAFELVESAKQTYIAKNEMESLLNQNAKVNTSGINAYNAALDETARKYQKINKYSLGETGAAIGLEFNLNAQEMAKSLDVIAMIQSEYVRAGRTTEEASLAVKDILQGEFMRLSRETGVGKDDLQEKYGWNGDTTDVLNLMAALEKAGKERHWDVFAAKATSLNDVLTITQSRFSELGAEIATHAEPLILGAFNTILDAVDGLKKGFEGLGSEGKTFTIGGGIIAGVYGLGTAYLMLAKNMGAVDIATMGFRKSMASAILQLNKSDVVMHGLGKTLLANLSGVEASTIANTGFTKSLVGRILGLNQTAISERGLKNAMVESVSALKEGAKVTEDTVQITRVMNKAKKEGISLENASILTKDKSGIITTKLTNKELTRSQRLAYMATNLKYAEVAELSRGQAILKTATSWKVLKTAVLGVTSIAIIGWLASVYAWTDKVKKNVEGFYNVVDNGESLLKEAQNAVDSNSKALDDVNAQIEKRKANNQKYSDLLREQNGLLQDQKTAQSNLYNTQKAVELAKVKSERLQNLRSRIDTHHTTQLADAYIKLGNNTADAQLKANNLYSEVKVGSYYAEKALEKYDETLTNGVYHSLAHAQALKKQGVDQEKLNQYMADYNLITEEVAENWKKFNEGDIWAGASAVVGQLKQAWADFMVTPEADTLFGALGRFVTWITPSVKTLIVYLEELGKWAINGFAWLTKSDLGNASLAVGGLVTGVGLLIWKFKDSIVSIKDFGKAIVDRIKDLKNLKKASEETSDVLGGGKSTGGIAGETKPDGKGWWDTTQLQKDTRKYARAAVAIAAGMVLIAEAIAFMMLPMATLAVTGEAFEYLEPSIRKGIRGLQLIAPVMAAFLPPVVALMTIMQYYGEEINTGTMKTAFKTSAQVIATGMLLVSEAIVMMVAPMVAIAALGSIKGLLGDSVEKGKQAIEATTDALGALVPVIPLFVIAIGWGIIALSGVGALASAAIVASGMLLVSGAIVSLAAPMAAISLLGALYPNVSGIRKGAETIKATAEAMSSLAIALGAMVLVDWELITHYIDSLVMKVLGIDLTSLTEDGGFFTQLNTFITDFNTKVKIDPIDPTKVESLNAASTGLGTLGDALGNAKTAMENMPDEFKTGKASLTYDSKTDTTSISDTGEGYFDQFKQPLEELGTFINWFNTELKFPTDGVDTDKLDTISQSADMVAKINDAVNKVKETMGNIGMGNIATNFAQSTGGGIPAFGGLGAGIGLLSDAYGAITGSNGAGDYQSSIGGQLHEMELVIKDLVTFSNNISGASNGGGAFGGGVNTDALTQMVTTVSDAITKLNDTLAQAVPNIKQNATNIGSGIKEGIKTGMGTLDGIVVTPLVAELGKAKAQAATYGKGIGWALTNNYKSELKIQSATETEISGTLTYLEGKKQDFYNKGHDLGDSLSKGYKDGQKMHSPGIIARSTEEELGRVGTYFDEAIFALPQKAVELGENISSNFNPQLAMGGLSADELGEFQSGLDTISSMSSTTSLQTSTDFTNMSTSVSSNMANISTNVGGTFNTINQNATTSYAQLTNTTRTALNNMQSQTTKNIQGIKSSWRDMQTALIQSAENIRSETGSKIKSLESNMASFWNKVQNPANLLGGAGNPFAAQHSIRRRTSPVKSSIGFAGSGTNMGISSRFKSQKSKTDPSIFAKLFEIIGSDFPMYAGGGWSFNWSDDIRRTLLQWRTHFGEIYDNHLTVGKFENDDFPVRGIAEIAKNYIYDAISRTHYVGYFDSRYGDDPLAAWNAGGFNCWDGTNVVLALASAFGFSGSRVHGSWDGVPHVWARIPGLGDIDATAIQQGYGFTASKVRGAGSVSPAYTNPDSGTTNNYNGDINIHIHTDGNDVEVDDRKIDSETGRKIIDLLGINPSTGR